MGNSESVDRACLELLDAGKTYREIAKLVHVSYRRIAALACHRSMHHGKVGRPRVVTDIMRDYIDLMSATNATIRDREMTIELNKKFGMCP